MTGCIFCLIFVTNVSITLIVYSPVILCHSFCLFGVQGDDCASDWWYEGEGLSLIHI